MRGSWAHTHLFNPSLSALGRSADSTLDLPPADVVLRLCDLNIERIHLLLDLTKFGSPPLLVDIFILRAFSLSPLLRFRYPSLR